MLRQSVRDNDVTSVSSLRYRAFTANVTTNNQPSKSVSLSVCRCVNNNRETSIDFLECDVKQLRFMTIKLCNSVILAAPRVDWVVGVTVRLPALLLLLLLLLS